MGLGQLRAPPLPAGRPLPSWTLGDALTLLVELSGMAGVHGNGLLGTGA